ncbi:MAG: shikimate kinase [Chitinophagaceae bacterium]|nr:MAG: shikimate kinase [Chitinophagaceae bacterium]
MTASETHSKVPDVAAGRIFLIGFMGTGKSHWGKIWAARHHYEFIDLDDAVEQDEQRSVTEIFESRGEDYFRQKEAIMLRSLLKHEHVIVACGGGTACFFDNIIWMKNNGTVICLDAPPATILHNILTQENKRPLVKNLNEAELLFFIEQKLAERQPFYTQAHRTLQAQSLDALSLDTFIS